MRYGRYLGHLMESGEVDWRRVHRWKHRDGSQGLQARFERYPNLWGETALDHHSRLWASLSRLGFALVVILFCYAGLTLDPSRVASVGKRARLHPSTTLCPRTLLLYYNVFGAIRHLQPCRRPAPSSKVAIRRRSSSWASPSPVYRHDRDTIGILTMETLMSMTALVSAALALLWPTRLSTVAALILNGAASAFGWWNLIT